MGGGRGARQPADSQKNQQVPRNVNGVGVPSHGQQPSCSAGHYMLVGLKRAPGTCSTTPPHVGEGTARRHVQEWRAGKAAEPGWGWGASERPHRQG